MTNCLAAGLGAGEIILIVVCVAVVLGVIVGVFLRKRKGKCACCDECPGHCECCKQKHK